MKTRLSLLAAALVLHSCGLTPLAAKPPAKIPAEPKAWPAVTPPQLVLSEADVRATVAHMETLAKDQEERIAAQDDIINRDNATITKQAGELSDSRKHEAASTKAAADAAVQVKAQDASLAAEKRGRFLDKLFGWPIAVGLGVVIGIFLSAFTKVGVWVATTAGQLALKV